MFSMRLHEYSPIPRRHAKARAIGGLNRRDARAAARRSQFGYEACKSTKSYIQNETDTFTRNRGNDHRYTIDRACPRSGLAVDGYRIQIDNYI
jgi:hypothetical protein